MTGTLVVLFNMSLMDNGEPELNVSKMIEAFLVRTTTMRERWCNHEDGGHVGFC